MLFRSTCENILHFFQLIWSGKFENLRSISIHKLFDRLSDFPNIISNDDLSILKNAYYYFRWIEDTLHIKNNSKINTLSFNDSDLSIFDNNIDYKLLNYSKDVIDIYNKLFKPDESHFTYDLNTFNSDVEVGLAANSPQ